MARRRRKRRKKINWSSLVFAILCILVGYVLNDILNESYARMENQNIPIGDIENAAIKSHYINVGQGDSIFIELPSSECMLIDAGDIDSGNKIVEYIRQLGYKKIDYLIATHPHADHIGGMKVVVNTFDIGLIYMPKVVSNTSTYINLLKAIDKKGLKIKNAKAGVNIIDSEDLKINIIAPNSDTYEDFNDYSAVIKLIYKNVSYLYMGDAEKISETEIKTDVSANVIKVGHHGSDSSSSWNFIKRVNPSIAVIQVGENNTYGHPKKVVLDRFEKLGTKIYRNDLNGNIVISTDGDKLSIATEK